MRFRNLALVVALLVHASSLAVHAAPVSRLRIAPVPAWVVVHEVPELGETELKSHSGASYALLIDRQIDLASKSSYVHLAVKILSPEGVQGLSEFTVDHDPSFQTLALHTLRLRRGGQEIDKLGVDPIQTLQRESSAEQFLYDGTLTSSVHLSDVRVGDIIEYAYTRSGENPAYGGRASGEIPLELAVPVERYLLRLRVPDTRNVLIGFHGEKIEPEVSREPGLATYEWKRERLRPHELDNNVPAWYFPYPTVRYTEFAGWGDMVNWALPMYQVSDSERERLRKLADGTLELADSPEAVLAAIHFVQDDIRYLALMEGLSAYLPHPPAQVWKQRYGDCKDKSLLLCTLLNEMGAQAYPMLVRSVSAQSEDDYIIAPGAFDHCVVAFRYQGRMYFVDPTVSHQGGDLEHLYFPDYGFGLIISPDSPGLVPLPEPAAGRTSVTEHFQLDDTGGGTLSVASEYQGVDADGARGTFASLDLASVQKAGLSYYATVYPDIESDGDVKIIDEHRNSDDVLVMIESFRLAHLWALDANDTNRVFLRFYPLALEKESIWNTTPGRTMPYAIGRADYRYEYIIDIPWWMPVAPENVHISGKAFDYRKTVSLQSGQVSVVHQYKRTKRYIDAADVADFIAKHDRIQASLAFVLIPGPLGTGGISWMMVIVTVICVIICTVGAVRIYRRYDPEPRVPRDPAGRAGIGGWLILPAIALLLSPLVSIRTVADLAIAFDARIIHAFGSGFTALLVFETVAAVVGIAIWALLLVSFFKRRSSVIALFIAFMIARPALLMLDLTLTHALMPSSLTSLQPPGNPVENMRLVLFGLVWIPYFLYSDRVRRTFVVRGAAHAALPAWQQAHVEVPRPAPGPAEQQADDLEERAREMLKAGASPDQVVTWLREQGLSPEMAALVLNVLATRDRKK